MLHDFQSRASQLDLKEMKKIAIFYMEIINVLYYRNGLAMEYYIGNES